jgi:hypothetical protein
MIDEKRIRGMRSKLMATNVSRCFFEIFIKVLGCGDDPLDRPLIGITNTANRGCL